MFGRAPFQIPRDHATAHLMTCCPAVRSLLVNRLPRHLVNINTGPDSLGSPQRLRSPENQSPPHVFASSLPGSPRPAGGSALYPWDVALLSTSFGLLFAVEKYQVQRQQLGSSDLSRGWPCTPCLPGPAGSSASPCLPLTMVCTHWLFLSFSPF